MSRTEGPAMGSGEHGDPARLPYEKPSLQRVELSIDETLSGNCKLGNDAGCVGPPITAFEGGS